MLDEGNGGLPHETDMCMEHGAWDMDRYTGSLLFFSCLVFSRPSDTSFFFLLAFTCTFILPHVSSFYCIVWYGICICIFRAVAALLRKGKRERERKGGNTSTVYHHNL